MAVDDCAPRAADPPGLRERAAGELAEDVEEHVIGEAQAGGISVAIHLAGRQGAKIDSDEAAIDPEIYRWMESNEDK